MAPIRFPRMLLIAGAALLLALPAFAQSSNGPGWFVPKQGGGAAAARSSRTHTPARAAAPAPAEPTGLNAAGPAAEAPPPPIAQADLPPPPPVPDVSRGAMPPAAVIGVLSIPDVLRHSTAYQAADKTMAERRQKLNEDAQKEQVALRDLGQALANERSKLSADQIRSKERELQDRITESRRKFTERGRIIQEASQYALAQIERTLSDVVQKVAASRGMNLVLQRAEVALNQAEFDITPQVAELLNKALPSVVIPPEGVAPTKELASAKPEDAKGSETKPAASKAPAHPAQHH